MNEQYTGRARITNKKTGASREGVVTSNPDSRFNFDEDGSSRNNTYESADFTIEPILSGTFDERVRQERRRQVEKGYDAEHDRAHGADHLLMWAVEYAGRGEAVKSAALVEAARELLSAPIEPILPEIPSEPGDTFTAEVTRDGETKRVVLMCRSSREEWQIAPTVGGWAYVVAGHIDRATIESVTTAKERGL